MLEYDLLSTDQLAAIDRAYECDDTLMVADMGAGKTVCALTAASELLSEGVVKRVFVLATLKICNNVWKQEAAKWSHLTHLNVAIATGSRAERSAAIEDMSADIVCINFDNLAWFAEEYGDKKLFDGYIIDEVTKLKSTGGSNFKKFRKYIKTFKWRLCMTGTPVSENWESLFGICFMTDGGEALGRNKQKFLDAHFYATDYQRRNWEVLPLQDAAIMKKVGHLIHVMPDYRHELPDLNPHVHKVPMDEKTKALYRELQNTMMLEGEDVVATNAAVLSGKLQQLTQGFLYSENSATTQVNTSKLDELWRLVHTNAKTPIIIVYWYKEDLERLQKLYPHAATLDDDKNIERWNNGEIDILLLQPRSAGHGLNLAQGGYTMIFYSMVWSNDLNKQTIARLWRRGQKYAVELHMLIMGGSIDEIIASRIEDKEEHHKRLLSHFNIGKV